MIAPPVFDRVTVRDDAGAWRTLTAEQFLALPLNLRIQHILARDIQFFRGDERVDRAKALKSLRR